MNCKYVMVLLLCLGLSGCAQQNSIEGTPASQTAENVNNEEKPEGMKVDEEAEYEVEEESGFSME